MVFGLVVSSQGAKEDRPTGEGDGELSQVAHGLEQLALDLTRSERFVELAEAVQAVGSGRVRERGHVQIG